MKNRSISVKISISLCLLFMAGILLYMTPIKAKASGLDNVDDLTDSITSAITNDLEDELNADSPNSTFSVNFESGNGELNGSLRILLILTFISFIPAMLVMLTSFTRIIIVLHFTRTALGTQTAPPNQVLIGLQEVKVFNMLPKLHKQLERIQKRFPEMNIFVITEGIDTSKYDSGKPLAEREIDLLEYGRGSGIDVNVNDNVNVNVNGFRYVCTKVNGKFYTDEELFQMMGNSKVTIALPRCDTDPTIAAGVETLTQRYWENMLSRIVMVGRAPKELTDLIGYNPVIELDRNHARKQILYILKHILKHIEDYHYLVDRNRETALQLGDWTLRMREVMEWLRQCGYEV